MLEWMLLPPGSLLLLLLLAAMLRRGRPALARLLVVASGLLLYVVSTPFVAATLLGALERYPSPSAADIAAFHPDAIVVLAAGRRTSAPEFGGTTVGSLTLERIRYAARLERQFALPLFVAGGDRQDGRSLAELMRTALAEDYGVAVAGMETTSENTAENAEYLAPVLQQRSIRRILLVTHSWHMPRARRSFERLGFVVLPAPTGFVSEGEVPEVNDLLPSAGALSATSYALHEIIGYAWYELRYW